MLETRRLREIAMAGERMRGAKNWIKTSRICKQKKDCLSKYDIKFKNSKPEDNFSQSEYFVAFLWDIT